MIIVGGGYIGAEFAGIFHGLGVEVTQLYWGPLFLRGFDDDCRKTLAEEMKKKGVDLRFNADISKIEKMGASLRATVNGDVNIDADQILYATGRVPNTGSLGLENTSVQMKPDGSVVVDDYSKTNVDSIYAIGDCTNRMQLTPVAIAEGRARLRRVQAVDELLDDRRGHRALELAKRDKQARSRNRDGR